jgi:hypothetical protein
MGLTWSQHTVKNGDLIVCNSPFPTNDDLRNDVWDLWKNKKEELKADGFGIGKDMKTNAWKLSYFHNVTDTSYEKTVDKVHIWKHHFNQKLAKWESYINENRNVTPVKTKKIDKKIDKTEKYDSDDGDADVDDNIINGILKKYT